MRTLAPLLLIVLATVAGCRDISSFSTRDGRSFEGEISGGDFVRAGLEGTARMCLTFDADHLQDGPGVITTTDGRFTNTPLRPIPQLWHDPLSTLSFGEGRVQNMVYAATPNGETQDVLVVLSLMQSGKIEVRLVRGAPLADASAPVPEAGAPLFGVFTLEKRKVPCP